MIDDETILLLNAYLDGELSPPEALAIERRLTAEPALRACLDQLEAISRDLKAVLATRDPHEDAIALRVGRSVGQDWVPATDEAAPAPWWKARSLALAASLLVGIGIGFGLAGPFSPWPVYRDRSVADMVFAAHLRGLAAPRPFDVASSDRHVVKPWFNGRSTIAPIAPDLSNDGFPLLGGRIDIVQDSAVPTLVYGSDRHVISVTVVPSTPGLRAGEDSRAGSNMVRFMVGNLTYLAVSDLNFAELRRFVQLFQSAA